MHSLDRGSKALAAVDLVQGLALPEVQDRLHRFLRLEDTGQRGLAFYLTEVADRRLHQSGGYSSTAQFAEAHLGLDRRRTSELISAGRKLLTLPAIDRAFCEQQIGWSKVKLLLRVTSPEHEAAWLARALALPCEDLARSVLRGKHGSPPPAPGESKGLPEIRFPFRCILPPLIHQMIELAKQKLTAERGQPMGDVELLGAMVELFLNLEEDGSVPGRTRVSSSLYRIVLRPDGDGPSHESGTLIMDGVMDGERGPIPVDARALRCDAETVCVDGGDGCGKAGIDPETIDPMTTDPMTTDPMTTDPKTTDPKTTDPKTTNQKTSDQKTHAHLRRSWHPDTLPSDLKPDPDSRWLGLKIKASEAGGADAKT